MQVIITPKAQKHFKHLQKTEQEKVKRKLKLLEESPYSGKKLSGELKELRSLKAWPYRILYYISEREEKVYIASIFHRQGAY